MRNAFLVVVLSAGLTSSVAQGIVHVRQSQLDSMMQLIKRNQQEDSSRVRLLSDYAQLCFFNLNIANGLKAVHEARAISEKLNYRKGEAMYFESIAIFNRSPWIGSYYRIQANWILKRNSNFGPFGEIIPTRQAQEWESRTVLDSLKAALPVCESLGDKELLANLHVAIGFISYLNKDYEQASIHVDIALAIFRELNLSYQQLVIIAYKIESNWEKGKDQETKAFELEAVSIYSSESNKRIKALSGHLFGWLYGTSSRAILGLEYLLQADTLLKETEETDLLRSVYVATAYAYLSVRRYDVALDYYNKELALRKDAGYFLGIENTYLRMAQAFVGLKRTQEIPKSYWESFENATRSKGAGWFKGSLLSLEAEIKKSEGKPQEALQLFRQAVMGFGDDTRGASFPTQEIARCFRRMNDPKSAIKYGLLSYELSSKTVYLPSQMISAELLSQLYEESGQPLKALEYLKLYKSIKEKIDTLNSDARLAELEVQGVLQKNQRKIERLETESHKKAQENKAQRLWIFSIGGALLFVVILAFILYRNNVNRKKANALLNEQKLKIEEAYDKLKSAQSQLVQSEKMASLGELTAGIAHEIQNPLNFVNNFSEVNRELVNEMNDAITEGNFGEAKEIAHSLSENLEKINHHGKRADGIVKSMLQHSRRSSGQNELTDINSLCDEYLRLAYHGLRAKDKSFNAKFETHFDDSLPKINVVPQEIGRVVLNLINNAFYAVAEKKKTSIDDYEPMVIVSTKNLGDKIEINVQDNGIGILESVKEKIFQPFFTTKPTGQGTGLGLSLSYDIIKAHGGELKLNSDFEAGTSFTVELQIESK